MRPPASRMPALPAPARPRMVCRQPVCAEPAHSVLGSCRRRRATRDGLGPGRRSPVAAYEAAMASRKLILVVRTQRTRQRHRATVGCHDPGEAEAGGHAQCKQHQHDPTVPNHGGVPVGAAVSACCCKARRSCWSSSRSCGEYEVDCANWMASAQSRSASLRAEHG